MKIKPEKSRSGSIVKGLPSRKRFYVDGEAILIVLEKPIKSLGRWCDSALSGKEQIQGLRQQVVDGRPSKLTQTVVPAVNEVPISRERE